MDNPAGRLYAILKQYAQQADDDRPILFQWGAVLGTEDDVDRTLMLLTEVAALVPEIDRQIRVLGDSHQRELFDRYFGDWLNWITFYRLDGTARPSLARARLVDEAALLALGSLSSYLSFTAAEWPLPSENQVIDLRSRANKLLEAVRDEESLDPEVRRILVDYVHRLLWALDHLRIGGPEPVKMVTDHLVGQISRVPESKRKSRVLGQAAGFVHHLWAILNMGPQISNGIEGWESAVHALPWGQS